MHQVRLARNYTQEQNFESNQQDTVNGTEQQEEGSEGGHQDIEQGQQEMRFVMSQKLIFYQRKQWNLIFLKREF